MMGGGFGFGVPGLGMILFWGLTIALIVALTRGSAPDDRGGSRDARRILDERFARGEIDREACERARRDLS